jgi:hypothetical protein
METATWLSSPCGARRVQPLVGLFAVLRRGGVHCPCRSPARAPLMHIYPHGCRGQDDTSQRSDAFGQPPARHSSHSRGRRRNPSVAKATPNNIPVAISWTMSTVRMAARRGFPKILETPMSPNNSGTQKRFGPSPRRMMPEYEATDLSNHFAAHPSAPTLR